MAQNAAAVPDEAVKTDAQASFSGLSHARMAGTIAPKKKSAERMMASIQMEIMSVIRKSTRGDRVVEPWPVRGDWEADEER